MSQKTEVFLENIIKNKLFFVLIALSWGIGIRFMFQYQNIYLLIGIVSSIFSYASYKFFVWRYRLCTISDDLKILCNGSDNEIEHSKKITYLILLIISVCLSAFTIGFTAASLRFDLMIPEEQLEDKIDEIYIIGKIKEFENRDYGIRVYLKDVYQVNRYNDKIIQKIDLGIIRINLRQKISAQNIIGKWIFLKATLMPPPPPAFPKSFDFGQYAFFKGIGAIGYALQRPVIIDDDEESDSTLLDYAEEKLNELRKSITSKIKNAITEPSSGITAAILVGENSQINSNDFYALRVAGLAHIIAISGMHVVVVVGIAFFLIKALLLYVVPTITNLQIALYCSVSKISAIFSILLSTFYVFLSGAPVSAQRALITSSIVMLCIVYDKYVESIQSLCVAAIIMLLLTPEVLFSPGLQMSFAACFALVTTFSICDEFFSKLKLKKHIEYFFKLIVASGAASLATAPFIIYHFNQFAPYGVIANLVCVPLSDFVIMPFGMLSMLLMPFGLEKFPLIILQYSIDFMLYISYKISQFPHADIHLAGLTKGGIIVISIGLFIFCVSQLRYLKITGIVVSIAGCFMFEKHDNIILIVNSKTFAIKHSIISDINVYDKFIFSSKQKDRFAQEVWRSKIGQDKFFKESINTLSKKKRLGINSCTSKLCISKNNIFIVNDVLDQSVLSQCNEKKPILFINMYDNTSCDAAKNNITAEDFKRHGAHLITYENDQYTIIKTIE